MSRQVRNASITFLAIACVVAFWYYTTVPCVEIDWANKGLRTSSICEGFRLSPYEAWIELFLIFLIVQVGAFIGARFGRLSAAATAGAVALGVVAGLGVWLVVPTVRYTWSPPENNPREWVDLALAGVVIFAVSFGVAALARRRAA